MQTNELYRPGAKRSFSRKLLLPIFLCSTFLITAGFSPEQGSLHFSGPKDTSRSISADELLAKNSEFYASLKSFTVDMSIQLNFEQGTMKAHDGATYSVSVQYPNRMKMDLQSGSDGFTLISDGTNLLAYSPSKKKYALAPTPPLLTTISEKHLGGLRSQINPLHYLAPCLNRADFSNLTGGGRNSKYMGKETLGGVLCHHSQFSHTGGVFNVWSEIGAQPVIRRISLDLSEWVNNKVKKKRPDDLPLHAEVVVNFDHWRLNPDLPADTFKIIPPADATRIGSNAEPVSKKTQKSKESENDTLVGKPAPQFKLPLLDGGQLDLAGHKNKQIVVLQFWAGWSVPSMRELPEIARMADSYKKKNQPVVFYAINKGQTPEAARSLVSNINPAPTVAIEKGAEVSDLYKVPPPPFYVVIDKQGIIRYHTEDYRYPNSLEHSLNDLLAEEKPGPVSHK